MPQVQVGSDQIRQAYAFLLQAENDERVFTMRELSAASGWTEKTARTTRSKKLKDIVQKVPGGYVCKGVKDNWTEEAFCRLCSQSYSLVNDPQRPRLPPKVEGLVQKARESALAAVQHYNNPTAVFRSGNYIVLMTIAYTSLFHAILERDRVEYIARDKNGQPRTANNETILWDMITGAQYYSQHYMGKSVTPMLKNLEFMVPIRNSIEHRFMPTLDPTIAGHCQAMLMNFEKILVDEFTRYYSLSASLGLALQFSMRRSQETVDSLRRFQGAEYEDLKQYITQFQSNLPTDILNDPAFVFRVWLIPKTANRPNASDLAIEFVQIDDLSPEQRAELEQSIIAVKSTPKERVIEVAQDPSSTHPYRTKELLIAVNIQLNGRTTITPYDIQCINKVYDIKNRSDLHYQGRVTGSPIQYSYAFADWIISQYNRDPTFFEKTRQESKQGVRHDIADHHV